MTAVLDAPTASTPERPTPERLLSRMGAPLDPTEFDWLSPPPSELDDERHFQLAYAAQVEWATEGTFASLDITDDPRVSSFLRIWLDQEVVHGELLAGYLAVRGGHVEMAHRTPQQRRAARRGRHVNRLARAIAGRDFLAVHMAWGAVNELTTLRFYGLIRDEVGDPLLDDLLSAVMRQEALHYAFYRAVAIEHLEGNRRAQCLVRWAFRHLWSPVGAGLRTDADADRLLRGLLADRPHDVAKIDAAIETMPGLEGLGLVRRAVDRACAAPR